MRASSSEIADRLSNTLGMWAERSVEEYARSFNTAERQKLAKEGKALPDGSYPIASASDIQPALTLARSGHGNVSAAMAHIRKRAKQLGVKVGEKADADADDAAILAAIKRVIAMQQGDTDSPSDAKVMSALRQALAAQEADLREN